MGKKKDKAMGSAKIPKQVAGVKVPKELRKAGAAIFQTVNSPAGRQVIASGAVAVLTSVVARSRAARDTTPHRQSNGDGADANADAKADAAGRIDPTEAGAAAGRQIVDALSGLAGAAMLRFIAEAKIR